MFALVPGSFLQFSKSRPPSTKQDLRRQSRLDAHDALLAVVVVVVVDDVDVDVDVVVVAVVVFCRTEVCC